MTNFKKGMLRQYPNDTKIFDKFGNELNVGDLVYINIKCKDHIKSNFDGIVVIDSDDEGEFVGLKTETAGIFYIDNFPQHWITKINTHNRDGTLINTNEK